MQVPNLLQLAGRTWTVMLVEDLRGDDGDSCLGLCTSHDCTIKLDKNQSEESMEHSFWHELMHAVCYTIGYKKLNKDEERIDAIACSLMQAMKTKRGKLT